LVVGDIHGCADELRALVRAATPDRIVAVGDLFTKGPDPAGVWGVLRDVGAEAVLGNHDDRLLRVIDGLRPKDDAGAACVAALDQADLGWRAWVRALPLFREGIGPYTVVHAALHPSGDLAATAREVALVQRRWPGTKPSDPRWTSVYTGERRVIYGHDAVAGHVVHRRAGVPWLVGLDSGCVYGGRLTGWIAETDACIAVPARRVYRPIDG
jgi:hypothetical protein